MIIEIMGIYEPQLQSLAHSQCQVIGPVTISHGVGLKVAADPQTILLTLAFNLWSQDDCCKVDIVSASLCSFYPKPNLSQKP